MQTTAGDKFVVKQPFNAWREETTSTGVTGRIKKTVQPGAIVTFIHRMPDVDGWSRMNNHEPVVLQVDDQFYRAPAGVADSDAYLNPLRKQTSGLTPGGSCRG